MRLQREGRKLAVLAPALDQGHAPIQTLGLLLEPVTVVLVVDDLPRDQLAGALGVPQRALRVDHRRFTSFRCDPDGLEIVRVGLHAALGFLVPHPVEALLVELDHRDVGLGAADDGLDILGSARRDVDRRHKKNLLPVGGREAASVRDRARHVVRRDRVRAVEAPEDHGAEQRTPEREEPGVGGVAEDDQDEVPEDDGRGEVEYEEAYLVHAARLVAVLRTVHPSHQVAQLPERPAIRPLDRAHRPALIAAAGQVVVERQLD
mmetsp:Transcript_64489/g.181428  ORF Transcript_64489/g.181428 Transcript_64489/m.181428 type:complete len:262 (+) Transcript_64489:962-1747(+)